MDRSGLSENAIKLHDAFLHIVSIGNMPVFIDVLAKAGLNYRDGREALEELKEKGFVEEVGNLG